MKHPKTLLLITLALVLNGCSSPLGLVTDVLTPSKGISVDTQIGEEANKQIVNEQTKTSTDIEIDADGDVTQSTENNNITNTNIDFKTLILIILGWILPSPKEIYTGIKREIASFFKFFIFKSK